MGAHHNDTECAQACQRRIHLPIATALHWHKTQWTGHSCRQWHQLGSLFKRGTDLGCNKEVQHQYWQVWCGCVYIWRDNCVNTCLFECYQSVWRSTNMSALAWCVHENGDCLANVSNEWQVGGRVKATTSCWILHRPDCRSHRRRHFPHHRRRYWGHPSLVLQNRFHRRHRRDLFKNTKRVSCLFQIEHCCNTGSSRIFRNSTEACTITGVVTYRLDLHRCRRCPRQSWDHWVHRLRCLHRDWVLLGRRIHHLHYSETFGCPHPRQSCFRNLNINWIESIILNRLGQ